MMDDGYTSEDELLRDGDEDLSQENHIRLAAEAIANSRSLEEVRKALDEQLADLKAKW